MSKIMCILAMIIHLRFLLLGGKVLMVSCRTRESENAVVRVRPEVLLRLIIIATLIFMVKSMSRVCYILSNVLLMDAKEGKFVR